ncbi:MAG: T9SS type A sorting domain-containing protein [Bacteroidales bacterium]|nr:T9SS type A sorting domain-containing protein [Bacteroidales bacterium]
MKTSIFILLFITASLAANSQNWTQVGNDIDGEAAGDKSGYSVSLSDDGSVVAIGAIWNDGNGDMAGHVRVYENNAGTWTQIGNDIDGEAAGDYSGYSVSFSADGSVVAIGAPENYGNGTDAGHVRVYENYAGIWIQIGNDIDGEAAGDWSGSSISLSADGSVLIIGARNNDGNGANAGHVRIYENIIGTWTQIGDDIDGEAVGDQSGYSVNLSADGSVVAIGAPYNAGNGSQAGHVRVYENNAGSWTQIGNDIDGEAAGDQSGCSVSLNSDGSVVAIGAYLNTGNGSQAGHVRVYENNVGSWTQIGNDIDAEAAGDHFGWSVSLSLDGSVVAIGAYLNSGNGSLAGHVRVYENNAGSWTQIGNDIDGEADNDFSGTSVSISADGSVVAIGALWNDGIGCQSGIGHVRVYSFPTGIEENLTELTINIFPNPVSDILSVDFQPIGEALYTILDTRGREIIKGTYSGNQINVSSLPTGTYFLQIENDGKLYKGEFVKD